MASIAEPQLTLLRPYFKPSPPLVSIADSNNNRNNNNSNNTASSSSSSSSSAASEPPSVQATIAALNLLPHPEGGYFAVTDIDQTSIPSPYDSESSPSPPSPSSSSAPGPSSPSSPRTRNLSSTILYLLTPRQPAGHFHKCRSRIIHSLHRGRARYVLIHPSTGRIESFVVGADILAGERLQWVVDGDVWKATILLPDEGAADDADADADAATALRGPEPASDGMLITETVAPGFDYSDHAFLTVERLRELVPRETAEQLEWLIKQ